MDCVERSNLEGRERGRGAEQRVAHVDEQAKLEEAGRLFPSLGARVRDRGRPQYLDQGDAARRDDRALRGQVGGESVALGLVDDELDERRGVGIDEPRLSDRSDPPRAPRSPSAGP
jgi:hypothetical protein